MFGTAVAQRHPHTDIAAVDRTPVLAIAQENARARGVSACVRTLAGDAYTLAELQRQLEGAGFSHVSACALPMSQTILLAQK